MAKEHLTRHIYDGEESWSNRPYGHKDHTSPTYQQTSALEAAADLSDLIMKKPKLLFLEGNIKL